MQMQKQAKEKQDEMLKNREEQLGSVIKTLKSEKEFIQNQYLNEKRVMTDKIQQLESRLAGSEDQVLKFGEAIDKLTEELKIREDPAKNALSIVDYLEQFSRHQTGRSRLSPASSFPSATLSTKILGPSPNR